MTAFDALKTHARDELHITEVTTARPVTAAFTSAATFTAGAMLPLVLAAALPASMIVPGEATGSILFLACSAPSAPLAGGAKP
jgi:VIT1/CCC1 family predicted Fe2+/Mn2+ transporter